MTNDRGKKKTSTKAKRPEGARSGQPGHASSDTVKAQAERKIPKRSIPENGPGNPPIPGGSAPPPAETATTHERVRVKRDGPTRPWQENLTRYTHEDNAAHSPTEEPNAKPMAWESDEAPAKPAAAASAAAEPVVESPRPAPRERPSHPIPIPVVTPPDETARSTEPPQPDFRDAAEPAQKTPETSEPRPAPTPPLQNRLVRRTERDARDAAPFVSNLVSRTLAPIWRSYHGFELHGAGHVPKEGPALLVCALSPVPLDSWYLLQELSLRSKRRIIALGDRSFFSIPGIRYMTGPAGVQPGDVDTARHALAKGHLVAMPMGDVGAPGVRATGNGEIDLAGRVGFARLAHEARCGIVPVYTANADNMYFSPVNAFRPIERLYEKTGLPLPPALGFGPLPFPVKLSAWVGPPVAPRDGETATVLADRARNALEELISKHRQKKSSLFGALISRFV